MRKKVRVNLKLARNGNVSNIEFLAMSDNPLLNASVKDAIINAQPFPAFPKDLPDDSLDVIINFDPEK